MTDQDRDVLEELQAKVGDKTDTFDWHDLPASARRDCEWGERLNHRGEQNLRLAVDRADALKTLRPDWLTAEDGDARFVREVEELVAASGQELPRWNDERMIDVSELATAIGRGPATTRRLLEDGAIPGAARKTPGRKNSPWLIPATSAGRFLQGAS